MKLNNTERLLVNNPVRRLVQRFYEAPLLRKLGGRLDNARVLEIGCGQGAGVEILLARLGALHVVGVDLDPEQIRRAQLRLGRKYPARVTFAVSSVERLPFPSDYFDAVVDFGVLHHVVKWQDGLAEIRRVLKPNGRFFFEEVTRTALNRWLYRTFLEHPTENRFNQVEFVTELAQYGIELLRPPQNILADHIFIGVGRRLAPTSA